MAKRKSKTHTHARTHETSMCRREERINPQNNETIHRRKMKNDRKIRVENWKRIESDGTFDRHRMRHDERNATATMLFD